MENGKYNLFSFFNISMLNGICFIIFEVVFLLELGSFVHAILFNISVINPLIVDAKVQILWLDRFILLHLHSLILF